MKKYLILLVVSLLLLTACSTIPEPSKNSESLVIGSFILDFPDGYFDGPKRTIDSNVTLKFYNKTTGEDYAKRTKNGYFAFVANTSDEIELYEYYYEHTSGRTTTSLGGSLEKEFCILADKINYLGDLKITYRAGKVVSGDRESSTYHFNRDYSIGYNSAAAKNHLVDELVESEWLKDDIINIEFK